MPKSTVFGAIWKISRWFLGGKYPVLRNFYFCGVPKFRALGCATPLQSEFSPVNRMVIVVGVRNQEKSLRTTKHPKFLRTWEGFGVAFFFLQNPTWRSNCSLTNPWDLNKSLVETGDPKEPDAKNRVTQTPLQSTPQVQQLAPEKMMAWRYDFPFGARLYFQG